MLTEHNQIQQLNWQQLEDQLNFQGYALTKNFLSAEHCDQLTTEFDAKHGYRKTVVMERYRYGKGVYKYWDYPLPERVHELREQLYPYLAIIVNRWMTLLNVDKNFPSSYQEFQSLCANNLQNKPTPLILKYKQGGFNTLHQDIYGDIFFPIQAVCFLSEPNKDYIGGEFVITQHVPRAQQKAIVLTPKKGDLLLLPTNFRPIRSARGFSRATMKHGVSEIQSGERYSMGIIFHDALG